jgi:hypothetical protein
MTFRALNFLHTLKQEHFVQIICFLIIVFEFAPFCSASHFVARSQHNKLKYHDLWYEINDSIVLNCSLRVGKDQHVSEICIAIFKFTCLI